MKARLLLVGSCAMLLSACGPVLPINAGLKQSGADILFGRPPASPAPPAVVAPLVPGFPAPIELPALPPLAAPPPLPVSIPLSCPVASTLSFPARQAAPDSPTPPVAATYVFRYQGFDVIDGGQPDQKLTRLVGNGTRQVTNIKTIPAPNPAEAAHYTFDVVETFQGWQQTNGYDVEESGPSQPVGSGVSPAAGIYLTYMTIQKVGTNTPSQDFRPTNPVQISTFPEHAGATFDGAGSDGNSTMEIDPNSANPNSGIVKDRVVVDACGTVLQAWQNLLVGRIVTVAGPGPNETFSLELDFGTQYGGLSLRDHLVLDQTDPTTGKPEHRDVTATIDAEPQVPKS